MNKFLADLTALSLGGAAAIILVALVRNLTKTHYAARWRCWVWLILCVRLLIPVSFLDSIQFHSISVKAPENVVIVTQQESSPIVIDPAQELPTLSSDSHETESSDSEQPIPAPVPPTGPVIRLYDILGIVWIAGVVAVLLWVTFTHLRFLSYLRRWSRPVREKSILKQYRELARKIGLQSAPRLRFCAGLHAPMLAGIFRNVILLPETSTDSNSLRHTLLHELSHYRRRDIWLKSIALLACAIHWFNPLVWYMHHMISQDTELACDEALLRFLPREEYKAYCRTILNSVSQIHDKKGERK